MYCVKSGTATCMELINICNVYNRGQLHVWSWQICVVFKIRDGYMYEANKYMLHVWSWEMCIVYKIRGSDMFEANKYLLNVWSFRNVCSVQNQGQWHGWSWQIYVMYKSRDSSWGGVEKHLYWAKLRTTNTSINMYTVPDWGQDWHQQTCELCKIEDNTTVNKNVHCTKSGTIYIMASTKINVRNLE